PGIRHPETRLPRRPCWFRWASTRSSWDATRGRRRSRACRPPASGPCRRTRCPALPWNRAPGRATTGSGCDPPPAARPAPATPPTERRERAGESRFSRQLIVQGERVLGPVPKGGVALTAETLKLSASGSGDHRIALLRLPALEYPGALQHEAAALAGNASDNPLEPDERCRAVGAVHHEVFDLTLPLDVAAE